MKQSAREAASYFGKRHFVVFSDDADTCRKRISDALLLFPCPPIPLLCPFPPNHVPYNPVQDTLVNFSVLKEPVICGANCNRSEIHIKRQKGPNQKRVRLHIRDWRTTMPLLPTSLTCPVARCVFGASAGTARHRKGEDQKKNMYETSLR
jgi:hypothetical protein